MTTPRARILVLAFLALAAATPASADQIVVRPVPEQLVEGHTVFAVIESDRANGTQYAAALASAAAPAHGSPAGGGSGSLDGGRGVLWFNDQYLVPPGSPDPRTWFGAAAAVLVRDGARIPCGGAVMAVNAGDPDPRVVLAHAFDSSDTRDAISGTSYGDDASDPTPHDRSDDPSYALVNVTTDRSILPPDVRSDALVTAAAPDPDRAAPSRVGPFALPDRMLPDVFDYRESYLITDPNDQAWIVDKYDQYTSIRGLGLTTVYSYPVWVANLYGAPVFTPDDGRSSCGPYDAFVRDAAAAAPARHPNVDQAARIADARAGDAWDATVAPRLLRFDAPPAGFNEPSRNGACYNGTPAPCATPAPSGPVRYYNALLYVLLQDTRVMGAPRDHSDPYASADTNGCQSGTEWACPGGAWGEDDDAEGNSHAFYPTPSGRNPPNPWHATYGANCPYPPSFGPNPVLHGGALIDGALGCDYVHWASNVDLYYAPSARPAEPLHRTWTILDLEGSAEAFHDCGAAYGWAC